jgi:Mor family transcriptional regulator
MDTAMMKALAERYPELIAPPFGEIARELGFDTLNALCGMLGGAPIYFPKVRFLLADCIERDIRERYRNGEGIKELAKSCGFSASHVRKIVRAKG